VVDSHALVGDPSGPFTLRATTMAIDVVAELEEA